MSFEERACWFRGSLTRLSWFAPVRRSGEIHQCAAGGMNAHGMEEYGEWRPVTAAVPFLKQCSSQCSSAFTIAISQSLYYAHSIMDAHIIIMTDSCVQNAFKRHSNGSSCGS